MASLARTVAFYTLGCKVNQYETEAMGELFARRGYRVVPFRDRADVYVINTCTVTGTAAQKSRQAVRRALRTNPEAVVAVAGCYPQIAPQEIASIPGVRVVLGTRGHGTIVDLVEQAAAGGPAVIAVEDIEKALTFEELPVVAAAGRTRAFLKVQEGCRNFCTFCIVPYARGPLRSRAPEKVLEHARALVAAGHRELVLTGTHLGLYGRDLPDGPDLAGLVARLLEVRGLVRLRLSSIEPLEVTPALLELMASSPVLCPHLHIPLQSGDDGTLRRMGRRYTAAQYAAVIENVRRVVPDPGIYADVMVGFPGEDEEAFRRSYSFVASLEPAGLHVFKYSPRAGTPAAGFKDQVAPAVKQSRLEAMLALDRTLRQVFAARFLSRVVEVLVERTTPQGLATGYTPQYVRVAIRDRDAPVGEVVRVLAEEVENGIIKGTRCEKKDSHLRASNNHDKM
ncbi:MAG: tRNA (N(6)-L-threonylcarbamoyladenosine(37)-C(2))-methylthiotransferase MtaB [Desulfotomaculales bacterium]